MNLSGLALACKCTIRYYPVQMRYLGIPLAEKMIHRSTLIRSNVAPHLPIPASISQNRITLVMYGITQTHSSCFHFYRVPCAAYREPSSKFVYLKRACPNGSFGPVVARNSEAQGSNPDRVGYFSSG